MQDITFSLTRILETTKSIVCPDFHWQSFAVAMAVMGAFEWLVKTEN
jgi:hypothetical protein